MSEGPRTITRNGRTAAVVVGAEQWQRETKRAGNLAEFFAGVSVARIEPEGPPAQGAPAENWSVTFFSIPTRFPNGLSRGQIQV
jgi:hypothetical protein